MAGIPKLPPAASVKLARLTAAADDADAMARTVVMQVAGLEARKPALLNLAASVPEKAEAAEAEVAALDQEIERLRAIQVTRRDRAQNDRQVVVRLHDALARWGSGTSLVPAAPPAGIASFGGPAVVSRLRQEIAGRQAEREAVLAAPLPVAELKARTEEAVNALAASGAPKLDIERGRFSIAWIPAGASLMHVVAFVVALDRVNVLTALHRQIDVATADVPGLSDGERAAKVAALDTAILELERREESAVEAAPEVARRPEADPLAVLGVAFAEEAARDAA